MRWQRLKNLLVVSINNKPSYTPSIQHLPLKSNHLTLQAGISDDE